MPAPLSAALLLATTAGCVSTAGLSGGGPERADASTPLDATIDARAEATPGLDAARHDGTVDGARDGAADAARDVSHDGIGADAAEAGKRTMDATATDGSSDGGTNDAASVDSGLPDASVCSGGVIVHLGSDPQNCGACGHDCEGGACSAGACQPVVVTSGTWGSSAATALATSIAFYWEEDVNACSCSASFLSVSDGADAGPPHLIAQNQDNPTPVVDYAGTLYYGLVYSSAIVSLAPDGTVSTLTTVAGQPEGVAVDGTNVYWTDIAGQQILATSVTGGAVATIAAGTADMSFIAVDDTNVYWSEPTTHAIVKATKAPGSVAITLTTAYPNPEGVVAQGGQVYFSADEGGISGGGIFRISPDGSGLKELAAPLGGAYFIATDATDVYWTGLGLGKAPLAGGATTTLAATGETYGLGVTKDSIFWVEADGSTGSVLRLAK
jgi:hypothetical protein